MCSYIIHALILFKGKSKITWLEKDKTINIDFSSRKCTNGQQINEIEYHITKHRENTI